MIVIGAGRIGTGLQASAGARGASMTLVDRGGGWEILDGPEGDPIVVAVRNDDLVDVIARVPDHRRSDLVFVQNGAIRELLRDQGLAGATRGVLYVLAARRDEPPIAGGTNVFCGPHALAVAGWFDRVGLPSETVKQERFAWFELEKLLWLAGNGPLCERYGVAVGAIATDHRSELEGLVLELVPVGRAAWGVDPDPRWLIERMVAYSLAIPEYRASVKEWPWRNGWLRANAVRHGIPTPLHDALLERTHPQR